MTHTNEIAIRANNLGKNYRIYSKPQDRLKQALWRGRKQYFHEFWALRDISFEVKRGETLGIIGCNGSGKSTLLQIISNTLTPTTGSVEVYGRIAALLELGAGFNPEFTGRENVYMNGAILGFSRQEMNDRFAEIEAFADIGEFIEQPVKTYSSGMYVRLAFAVQACVEPDILIIDEALAVGDIFFQQKCHARMAELLKCNTAIVLVSHDMAVIEKYSNQVLLLNKGNLLFIGQPNEAVERYYQVNHFTDDSISVRPSQLSNPIQQAASTIKLIDPAAGKLDSFALENIVDWPSTNAFLDLSQSVMVGNQSVATCTGVALCNAAGIPTSTFEVEEEAYFYYEFEIRQEIGVPVGGLLITDKMNINIHGKNSIQYLLKAPNTISAGTKIRFRQSIKLAILPGEYVFQVGLATMNAEDYMHITRMPHMELHTKSPEILRVRQAGKILVTEKTKGVRLPFHGCAELAGTCNLMIVL
jgi:lipopolysaccharide transport system ATP-binding protein